jgi:hypothetical protein
VVGECASMMTARRVGLRAPLDRFGITGPVGEPEPPVPTRAASRRGTGARALRLRAPRIRAGGLFSSSPLRGCHITA